MKRPVAKFNNFFWNSFLELYLRIFFLPNRDHNKAIKAIFVLFMCAPLSFIFVNNARLVHEGKLKHNLLFMFLHRVL